MALSVGKSRLPESDSLHSIPGTHSKENRLYKVVFM